MRGVREAPRVYELRRSTINIFVLSEDPKQAARDHCNKHVVKMIVEAAQLLCTALHINGVNKESLPYRTTHAGHPCTKWVAESPANSAWLFEHAIELCEEYTRRYEKVHKTRSVIESLRSLLPPGDRHDHTPFAQAMPDEWKHDDAVIAYRCYYIAEKSRFARWSPRANPPDWWPLDDPWVA